LIALSWLFLLAAIATLLIGVFNDLMWVYVSIGASVLAMILLLVGVVRRKPVQPATAGAPYGPPVGEASAAATTAVATAPASAPAQRRPATPSAPRAPAAKPTTRKPAAKKTAAKKTTAKKTTARKPAAKKTAAKKTTAASSTSRAMVVAIPERGTYHESGCRYVQGRKDTERLQKKTAQSRGFKACGVCKP
jgi:hypothetical protein